MLKFGNKEFRNLQEQVEENMKDIEKLKTGQAVLDEFGIKVVGEVSDIEDLPTVAEYKESTPDWEYGDAYAVGSTSPYTLYILTRANGTHEADYWFDIGEFPAVGPQGPQGPQGPEGQQGQTGDTGPAGADAGFGTPTATASMTARGSAPTVNVTSSGPNTEKVFNFDFYLPVATPKVTITSVSGTLTLAEYNILFNFEDSVVVFKPSGSLAHNAYTLQRWYSSDDYIVFICLYNYTPYKTGVYRCRVDRSNRSYLIYADEAIKINKWNISTAINSTTNETAGKVLTADGNGGASWEDAGSGANTVTINVISGTFSDSDYIKVAGDNCTIIYDDNSTKVSFRKYDETSTTITYAGPFTEGNMTYWYGLTINKSGKTWVMSSAAMPISASNIKSGSYVSGLVLTTNGSGGSSWESLPTPQSLTWGNISGTLSNQTDLKNALDDKQDELTEPDTPTGTIYEYLGFTSAGVVSKNTMVPVSKISDIADVAITGSYTDLLNQPSIPDPQVQSNWTQTNSSKIDYIKNKPTLSAVATTGDYDDLLNKPTIPTVDYPVTDVTVNGTSVLNNKVAAVTVPTNVSDLNNDSGYITGITSSDVTTALGYTPYDSSNPSGYTSNVGTVTSVNNISPVNGDVTISIPDVSHMVTDNTTQTITGAKTFTSGRTVFSETSLTFKDSNDNHNGYIENTPNGIDILAGTSKEIEIIGRSDVRLKKNSASGGAGYGLVVPDTSSFTADKTIATTDQCTYQTTAPTAAISDGGVHIVYLSAEPSTKYSGYIYMIAEA